MDQNDQGVQAQEPIAPDTAAPMPVEPAMPIEAAPEVAPEMPIEAAPEATDAPAI